MDTARRIQGRTIGNEDVAFVCRLIADHPDWSRNQIALALAEAWNWRTATGRLKNFAGSSLLIKLEKHGLIRLPPRRRPPPKRVIRLAGPELPWPDPEPITQPLRELLPLTIEPLSAKQPRYASLAQYLIRYHYLGLRRSVGENMAYLTRDRQGRAPRGAQPLQRQHRPDDPREEVILFASRCRPSPPPRTSANASV